MQGARAKIFALWLASSVGLAHEAAAVRWLPVWLSNEDVPGLAGGLEAIGVSDEGRVTLVGGQNEGIWSWGAADGLHPVAIPGSSPSIPPDLPLFGDPISVSGGSLWGNIYVSPHGDVGFSALIAPPTSSLTPPPLAVIHCDPEGTCKVVARTDDSAAGFSADWLLASPLAAWLDANGGTAFTALVGGPGFAQTSALFAADSADSISLVARSDQPAPDDPSLVLGSLGPVVGPIRSGPIVFYSNLTDPSLPIGAPGSIVGYALWRWTAADGLSLLARDWVQAPGMSGGEILTMDSFGARVNAPGEVIFSGALSGSGVTPDDDAGVWICEPASPCSLFLRKGDPLSRGPTGNRFQGASNLVLNDAGQVAFIGSLALDGGGTTGGAFGPDGAGNLVLRVQPGVDAPGIEGRLIGGIDTLSLGPDGAMVVETGITDPSTDAASGAIYRVDPSGQLTLLLKDGDLVEAGPSGLLPVTIGISSTFADRALQHVVVRAAFESLPADAVCIGVVPEPEGLALGFAALGGLGCCAGRRRSGSEMTTRRSRASVMALEADRNLASDPRMCQRRSSGPKRRDARVETSSRARDGGRGRGRMEAEWRPLQCACASTQLGPRVTERAERLGVGERRDAGSQDRAKRRQSRHAPSSVVATCCATGSCALPPVAQPAPIAIPRKPTRTIARVQPRW